MRRSTTWTHNSQPESNANISGVCLARSGCLAAANRPVSLFKQTPWGAREGDGGHVSSFSVRRAHPLLLSCYRFCLPSAERRTQLLPRVRSEAWTKEILESSIVCLRATEDPSRLPSPFPSSPLLSRRAVCFPSAAFLFLLFASCSLLRSRQYRHIRL